MTANLCRSNRAMARMPAGPLDPAPPVNGFTGASPLGAFFDEVIVPCRLFNAAPRTLEYYHVAVVHLGGYLGREPRIDDLTSKTIGGVMRWLIERGRTAQTANYSRCAMLVFAQVAVERGLLPEECSAPKMAHKYKRRSPWSIDELNRIILYAAANIGDVAGIPAGRWWPALLLVILDTHLSAETLLLLSTDRLDPKAGTLAEGDLLYMLHPRTLEAVRNTFDGPRPQLFPWHLDGCRPPFHMLFYHYRRILERAGLPATANDLFRRLVLTARKSGPRLIDRLDLTPLENPPAWADTYTGDNANRGRPRAKRKRSRSAAAKPIAAAAGPKKLYVIDLKSERTLKDFSRSATGRIGCSRHRRRRFNCMRARFGA